MTCYIPGKGGQGPCCNPVISSKSSWSAAEATASPELSSSTNTGSTGPVVSLYSGKSALIGE